MPLTTTLGDLKTFINEELGYSDDGVEALFNQNEFIEGLDDDNYIQSKLIDLFEAEEDDPSLYAFDCHLKIASGVPSWLKRQKKIELRNATPHKLEIHIYYKTRDFAKEKDKK